MGFAPGVDNVTTSVTKAINHETNCTTVFLYYSRVQSGRRYTMQQRELSLHHYAPWMGALPSRTATAD